MFARRSIASVLIAAGALAATLFSATHAMAGARSTVKIVNNSSVTVISVHSSPTYRESHGRIDLLGQYVLRSGYNIHVDFDTADAENECVQDVLAKGEGGQTWRRRMNICTTTTWTLTD
jgi:hypothetical protein